MNVSADEVVGFVEMDCSEIVVHEGRFRELDGATVKVIAESIKDRGQLQPILVTPNGDLIDGNHRYHACKLLKIKVIAKVVDTLSIEETELMEIDTNLCRKELSKTETEKHLAKRKELYELLYPDTAKRGAKGHENSGKGAFSEETAVMMGTSKKSVERMVKRGANASDELLEARDDKTVDITTGDVDAIITEVGADKEKQLDKMKELIQQKVEKKEAKKVEEVLPPSEPESTEDEVIEPNTELEFDIAELQNEIESLKEKLVKSEASNKRLKDRIAKAKANNPEMKI